MRVLEDGAFPMLPKRTSTTDLREGFTVIQYALLVGAPPRVLGMGRSDLMGSNAIIFAEQGIQLNISPAINAEVLVVGNVANENDLLSYEIAPGMCVEQLISMSCLEQSRANDLVDEQAGVAVKDVDGVFRQGDHSATQYPGLQHSRIGGMRAKSNLTYDKWIKDDFIPRV